MLLIDPPVTSYSSAAEIRAWIEELRRMRAEVAKTADDLDAVDREVRRANELLERAERA